MWARQGRMCRESLKSLRFRLLRHIGRMGIKANMRGEIPSSKGLLRTIYYRVQDTYLNSRYVS